MDYADIMTNDISTSYATWCHPPPLSENDQTVQSDACRRLKLEPLRLAEKEGVYGAHLCCTTDALIQAKFTLSVLNTHDEKRSITRGGRRHICYAFDRRPVLMRQSLFAIFLWANRVGAGVTSPRCT